MECVNAVKLASNERSGFGMTGAVTGWDDTMSTGLTVVVGVEELAPNSEGYISSGVERMDSGDPSNLTFGDAAPAQEFMSDILKPRAA